MSPVSGPGGPLQAIVLGAGPAGLAAAEALLTGGARVTLVEARTRVGGLAGSERVGAHEADLGPHRLHLESAADVRRLLGRGPALAERPRRGLIHLLGAAVAYPPSPAALFRALGPVKAARLAVGALAARLDAPGEDFAHTGRRLVGRPLFDALYAPAARKVWGVEPEALHADQARARIGAGGPLALFGRVLRGRGEPGRYLYPASGANGGLYRAWAADLVSRGLTLTLGAEVEGVAHAAGRVTGVQTSKGTFPADRVVSTLPLPRLLAALRPTLETPAAAEPLRFRTVSLLHVVVARARLTDLDVHYFPGEETPFARMTEQSAFGRTDGAPADETVLGFDFYDWPDGPLATATPEALLALVWPTLARFGVSRAEVRTVTRTVAPDAYPVLDAGYRRARDAALDALVQVEGLLSTGRGGLFLHVNQHHAIEMGLAAGRLARSLDACAGRWRAAARGFETLRIVD